MKEAKKIYIADALSELEDAFIEEAVHYRRKKRPWRFAREGMAVTACAAAIFISVGALHFVPIERNRSNEAVAEGAMQEVSSQEILKNDKTENAATGDKEGNTLLDGDKTENAAIDDEKTEAAVMEGTVTEGSTLDEGATEEPILNKEQMSDGVVWSEISAEELALVKKDENSSNGAGTSKIEQSVGEVLPGKEDKAVLTLKGTIIDQKGYRMECEPEKYFAILTINATESAETASKSAAESAETVSKPAAESTGAVSKPASGAASVKITAGTQYRVYIATKTLWELQELLQDCEKSMAEKRVVSFQVQAAASGGEACGNGWFSYQDVADYICVD